MKRKPLPPGDLVDVTIRVRLDEMGNGGIYWTPPYEIGSYRRWTPDQVVRKVRKVRRGRGKPGTRQGA